VSEFRWSSSVRLASPAAAVWAVASTPSGVNEELTPLFRMTFPAWVDDLGAGDIVPGETVCHCWVLIGGFLPFDRHSLAFESINDEPGSASVGFVEESTSWMQRRWRHERSLEGLDDLSCELTDTLTVVPRIGPAMPIVRNIVPRVFLHRHRQLTERWGAA
jgi:hypothetical protein